MTAGLRRAGRENSAIGEVETAAPPIVVFNRRSGCARQPDRIGGLKGASRPTNSSSRAKRGDLPVNGISNTKCRLQRPL